MVGAPGTSLEDFLNNEGNLEREMEAGLRDPPTEEDTSASSVPFSEAGAAEQLLSPCTSAEGREEDAAKAAWSSSGLMVCNG